MANAGNESVRVGGRRCPKCGATIEHLCYWEKAVNIGEYWPDGLHNMRTDYVIECYFACPKCGEILFFDDVEAGP
jgi:ribosomal protein S27AE